MKRLAAVLMSASVLCTAACAANADGRSRAETEQRVREAIDAFYTAARARDWDAAGALLAPDFEIYTDGAEGFTKDDYVALLKQDDLIVEQMSLRGMRVAVAGDGRMAWATFRGAFAMTSRGARHDVETAETLILSRTGQGWQIVRAHASVKPLTSN